jgi:polyisoprenyl-phosphate glycosyltransferase
MDILIRNMDIIILKRMSNLHISIVSPVYGCKTSIYELYLRLRETIEKLTPYFEIIFVNDASPDGAWETIKELANKDKRVIGIDLSRNFGQHYAITAGLDQCKGDWVVVMDCDLQDQPEEIIKLYNKTKEGYDYVQGRRDQRKDNFFKRTFSNIFYILLRYLTDSNIDSSIANFGIYNKIVIQSINDLREKSRWFPTFVNWVGYKGTNILIQHGERSGGHSGYSIRKLMNLALDVILLNSNKPLKLVVKFGLAISIFALFFAVIILFKYYNGDVTVLGWTSLIISIWFLSGIIIFIMGIIGLYLAKVYEHSKDRPLYIIKQRT